jgi:O-antigen ligase/Tfp pilus assembly protein PilF
MFRLDWQKIITLLLRCAYYLALAALPLGMSFLFPTFSPFNLVKAVWLHILGASIFILLILQTRARWRQVPLSFLPVNFWSSLLPVWIFFGVWAVLSYWSASPLQSWFGSYERQFGLSAYFWLALWHSFVVYYSSGAGEAKAISRPESWLKIVRLSALTAAIVGALVGLYAGLQFCGYDFAVWQEPQLYARAISTFGQPNLLASFLLLSLPLTVYYFSLQKRFLTRFFAIVLFGFQFLGLVVSGSRAAWLAFALTMALLILVLAWRRWRFWSLTLVLPLPIIILMSFSVLMPGRVQAFLNFNGGSLAVRKQFYEVALPVIKERPWLGIGLENGGEAIIPYYQQDWGVFSNINSYTDKVHNSFLDTIIQTGIIGFIFWAGLYLFWAWQCWRLWQHPASRNFALAAAAAMFAYSFSLLFSISDLTGVFYFWFLAALVVAGNLSLASGEKKSFFQWLRHFLFKLGGRNSRLQTLGASLLGVIIISGSLWQIYFSFSSLLADYYFLQLYSSLSSREYFTIDALYSYTEKNALNPINRIYYQRVFSTYAWFNFQNLPDKASQYILRERLETIVKIFPTDTYENLAVSSRLRCFLQTDKVVFKDFKKLINSSPVRPSGYRDQAYCLQLSGENEEAIATYQQALSLLPDRSDPRFNPVHLSYLHFYAYQLEKDSAYLYEKTGDLEKALLSYRQAYSDYPEDVVILDNISKVYQQLQDYPSALAVLEHAYVRQPLQAYWPLALAQLYQELGKEEVSAFYYQAANALQAEAEIVPENSQFYR